MSRLTLRLPETLHQQLTDLAEGEGVSRVRVTFLVEKLGWRRPGTIYQDHDS